MGVRGRTMLALSMIITPLLVLLSMSVRSQYQLAKALQAQGLRMKFCWVIDGMESGVIQGVSLKLGDLHVGEEVGGRIFDPG
jgi:hypothetical protein